jgi:hypothetical protein
MKYPKKSIEKLKSTTFTVSLMSFFRGVISKICFFCKLLQDISKKGFGRRRHKLIVTLIHLHKQASNSSECLVGSKCQGRGKTGGFPARHLIFPNITNTGGGFRVNKRVDYCSNTG